MKLISSVVGISGRNLGKPPSTLADVIFKRISVLLKAGITPLIIFDGATLPAKKDIVDKRSR